jgi:hypothetical protein
MYRWIVPDAVAVPVTVIVRVPAVPPVNSSMPTVHMSVCELFCRPMRTISASCEPTPW